MRNYIKKTLFFPGFLVLAVCSVFSLVSVSMAVDLGRTVNDSYIDRLLTAEHAEGEILVKFRDYIAYDDAEMKRATASAYAKTGAVVKKKFRGLKGLQLVKLPKNKSIKQALKSYLKDSRIEYAEPNYIVYATAIPDDPDFGNLWGLHNTGNDADIDAPEAWDLITGSSNVVVAVIDTGVAYNHPDLSANIWTNPGETSCIDNIDNDLNGYIDDCYGWDFLGNDNDPTDHNLYRHGTHVAGTIAAVGNNTTGVTGVMWQAKIMPLKFLGINGGGSTSDATSAILYANANGAHIINNSWGGGGYSQTLKNAIDASSSVVVCAAGNDGQNNDSTPFYPASYTSSNIISVAATDSNDNLAGFSNYGATSVDVAAPGVGIYSTVHVLNYGTPVTLYSENFDGASGNLPISGWDRGGSNSTWAVTSGTGVGGTNSLEDSPGADYLNNTDSWAGYMTPFTSVQDNRYTLSFMLKGDVQWLYDYLDINYSTDGSTWFWTDYWTGSLGSFTQFSSVTLTDQADKYDSFYFGLGLSSGHSTTADGVYIDDVVLKREPVSIGSYNYENKNGTSMAAPHVSGIAGLIKALNPGFNNLQVRAAILDNVDILGSLTDKVWTGGRVNAFSAICTSLPFRIDQPTPVYFSTLQAAYNAAYDGATIQSLAQVSVEDINFNLNISVTLEGGYDCNFTSNAGVTSLSGTTQISSGTITIGKFSLE